MKIIQKNPSSIGNYSSIQNWDNNIIPDGYYIWQEGLDESRFYQYNGFVILNVIKNTVIGYDINYEAWEAWNLNKPNPPEEEEDEDNESSSSNNDTEVLNILLGVI